MAKSINRTVGASSLHGETQSDRETSISMAAYYMAETRGFQNGGELSDWLAAEAKVDAKKPGE